MGDEVTTPLPEGRGFWAPAFRHGLLQQARVVPRAECFLRHLRRDHEPHRNRRKSTLLFAGLSIPLGLEVGSDPHSEQVWVVKCSGTSRHMPPPRNRDFHDSMVLKSDQPASRTLFAMWVGASFDCAHVTNNSSVRIAAQASLFPCAENPSGGFRILAWIAFSPLALTRPLRCRERGFTGAVERRHSDLFADRQPRQ